MFAQMIATVVTVFTKSYLVQVFLHYRWLIVPLNVPVAV